MIFRFWSLRAEESEATVAPEGRMTLRRALLLYKFNGPRAVIARFVFHCWAAVAVLVVVATALSSFGDPRTLPSNVISLVAWVGWAIGIRYWAVSLNERAARP